MQLNPKDYKKKKKTWYWIRKQKDSQWGLDLWNCPKEMTPRGPQPVVILVTLPKKHHAAMFVSGRHLQPMSSRSMLLKWGALAVRCSWSEVRWPSNSVYIVANNFSLLHINAGGHKRSRFLPDDTLFVRRWVIVEDGRVRAIVQKKRC